jgi:hypothetical protein
MGVLFERCIDQVPFLFIADGDFQVQAVILACLAAVGRGNGAGAILDYMGYGLVQLLLVRADDLVLPFTWINEFIGTVTYFDFHYFWTDTS